jgi:hypothetical protein
MMNRGRSCSSSILAKLVRSSYAIASVLGMRYECRYTFYLLNLLIQPSIIYRGAMWLGQNWQCPRGRRQISQTQLVPNVGAIFLFCTYRSLRTPAFVHRQMRVFILNMFLPVSTKAIMMPSELQSITRVGFTTPSTTDYL